jgi:hypothetical protein
MFIRDMFIKSDSNIYGNPYINIYSSFERLDILTAFSIPEESPLFLLDVLTFFEKRVQEIPLG